MKKFLKILLIFLGLQIATYFMFSDYQLQKQVESNFNELNRRRFTNKWAKKTKHNKYYFSSCGNEFFRSDYNSIVEIIKKTDPKDYLQYNVYDFNKNYYDLYSSEANDSTTIINFRVCKEPIINLFTTKITQQEIFSNHNDFHALYYNQQNIRREVYYIWFIFKWFKIIERNNEL